MNQETLFAGAVCNFNSIGPKTYQKLFGYFKSSQKMWLASAGQLIKAGLKSEIAEKFVQFRPRFNIDKFSEYLKKNEISILDQKSSEYPKLLKEIHDAPPVLFCRGHIIPKDEAALAVVGTRKMTPYAQRVIDKIVIPLAQNGLTIISGLALGVDSFAHQAALSSGGRTIAVLGSGVDNIYPLYNSNLGHKIIENGAVISEFPLGFPPLNYNFPQRNRIISGMSLGVLVIEAAVESGSLITAYQAIEQNREVFAIPGSIFSPQSYGCNNLIKTGAKIVTDYTDVLDELQITDKIENRTNDIEITNDEEKLLVLIDYNTPKFIDLLIKKSKMNTAQVNSILISLEIKGLIKNLGGGKFVKK
jgi:DNA processing protein